MVSHHGGLKRSCLIRVAIKGWTLIRVVSHGSLKSMVSHHAGHKGWSVIRVVLKGMVSYHGSLKRDGLSS